MSDAYNFVPSFFSNDARGGALTFEQLQARRKIAEAIATRNRPYPKTIGEGLTALGEALGRRRRDQELTRAEAAQAERDRAAEQGAPGGSYVPGAAPAAPPPAAVAPQASLTAPDTAAVEKAVASSDPLTMAQSAQQPQMSHDEWLQRTKRNETGGKPDPYRTIGPVSRRGDYPYGAYQVMGENIPKWTKKHLGREMTPQEFLADDKAQDQVARGESGEYISKYGPLGAARAWFAGERGMNDLKRKDTLGTHVAEYERRFTRPLTSRADLAGALARRPQASTFGPDEAGMSATPFDVAGAEGGEGGAPVRVAALGGMPTPDTPPDPMGGAPAPAQAPPPRAAVAQQLAQRQPMPGGIGPGTLGTAPPQPMTAPQQPQIPPAPSLPPSREPIPPPAIEEMPDPGATPPPQPQLMGPSQAQQYWLKQMSNPMLSDVARERAAKMYATEETYRKDTQARQAEEYRNQRERWEKQRADKDTHTRGEGKRIQEDLIRRLTIEKEQADAANRPVEAEALRVKLAQAIRDLNKPDTVSAGGTQFERPPTAPGATPQPYAVPAGLPQPKEDMTEGQAKAVQFVLRTKPDLDRLDGELNKGKALTSWKDAAIDTLGPGNTGNIAVSDEYRRARDASMNWGAAFLSHVSGQAVSPTEAGRNLPAFLPRPGDNDRDLEEKAVRRRSMTEAIEKTSGTAGLKVLYGQVSQENDAYEFRKNSERPPVSIKSAEEAEKLPPGTRLILPDGKPGVVPQRKR